MPWAAAAAVAGAVIASDSSRSAANKQKDAAQAGIDSQERMFDKQTQLQEPWRQAGIGALGQLTAGTAPGGEFMKTFGSTDFQGDPGLAFRLGQGTKALEASAAARGGLLSGGAGKDLVEYGQNFGSNEYANAYNRFNNDMSSRFNRLSTLAGLGQTATNQVGSAAQNAGNNISNLQTQIGNAQSAGQIGQSNAINGAIGTIGNWWQAQPTKSGSGSTWGSTGMNDFFFGHGTSGD